MLDVLAPFAFVHEEPVLIRVLTLRRRCGHPVGSHDGQQRTIGVLAYSPVAHVVLHVTDVARHEVNVANVIPCLHLGRPLHFSPTVTCITETAVLLRFLKRFSCTDQRFGTGTLWPLAQVNWKLHAVNEAPSCTNGIHTKPRRDRSDGPHTSREHQKHPAATLRLVVCESL